MKEYLDFEKPLRELEERINRLKRSGSLKKSVRDQIRKQTARLHELETELYSQLTPWQRSQIARHPERPSLSNYVGLITQNFLELHGDRVFGDDQAIMGGFALFQERPVMIIGQEKGKTLKERMRRNFGMPNPEGYRKALRLMKMAEKFQRPIITFIDTPGAYPGLDAEQRGQAEAIARNLMTMARLRVPIIAVITGEGGSGGALALGVADRVMILEHSIYSVISPEGCAAILWGDASKASQAASALKLTASELFKLGIVDHVITEPMGGAHRDAETTAQRLQEILDSTLQQLSHIPTETLLHERDQKFRKMEAIRYLQETTETKTSS
ncbi:MAG: acetyl-CoA carboxylase carboxyltransferase subunit alpha [Nitrospirales bacterium]|nr:acetyl-CoA carboxylase carboxyltransferase subunit alpha [Nitrospira sp.]MDR4503041.1 acetyl-CoA carboxylase carboxyltransferase subunit alpha [Nitrospirales bacterium]